MACRQCRSLLAWVPGLRAYSTAAVGPLGLASAQVQDPAHARRLAAVQGMKVEHALSADEASTSELEHERALFRLHNSSMKLEGSIIRARVVSVDRQRLLVDTGLRMASLAPADVTPDSIVYLEYVETPEGGPLVSGQAAAGQRRLASVWAELEARFREGRTVRGRVLNALHGGFAVGVGGLVAFLPAHAASWATQQRTGELREFRIRSMNAARRNVVVVDARGGGAREAAPPRPLREGQARSRNVRQEAEALKAALGMPVGAGPGDASPSEARPAGADPAGPGSGLSAA
ncbi:30S ribosomal protein S1 [Auxenochlorella protothecoides]|uniref:30S ribosomal protein S1 n=1 Tax=Auxenochlorella protothecoides TaxID=3075 RepID=A0A087SKK4_AUXPR|nr:30S ribosomal protein S1 [Auxenochlorella protothecoides]KFM26258.1 30S ribosomal protein S1 [Auxenochlorella protothecoides]